MSDNEQLIFRLMGGLALPERFSRPECARVLELQGLIPPWVLIEQEGANEDGTTVVDALYEPTDIVLKVLISARNAKAKRQVIRHLEEVLDAKRQCEFGWITHELGYWWAPLRWKGKPPDKYDGSDTEQEMTLFLQGDNAFYQSYPDVDEFEFRYEDMTDTFTLDRTDEHDLGANWPQYYTGTGGGWMYSNGDHALWMDDPEDTFVTKSREVVNGPFKDFDTETDFQVVSMVLGSFPEWSLPDTGANDLWARMGADGSGNWNGNGIRLRVHRRKIELTAFVDFDDIWTRTLNTIFVPFPGDKWTLACGYPETEDDDPDPRLFKVYRNGANLLTHKEIGTGSVVNSSHRGIGFGARAASAIFTQATPAIVRKISAGDNAAVEQVGYLERRNAGDQTAYDTYTVYGPATKVEIANGPNSTDMVEIHDLKVGEVAVIRTDPRRGGIFDPFANNDSSTPALFGANPSDTMYRKMKGHFTAECAIPPKEPGMRVATHRVKVSMTGGTADSRIAASLTPLRRRPE
ncbi:DUF7257 domain-containing protein [Mycolicibacterium gilvum]|uniref:DUF7257 domain-containing protein n=1 Tax=Mycolicibacterium gilvum TaxID=1804 RepID=UPI0040459A9A